LVQARVPKYRVSVLRVIQRVAPHCEATSAGAIAEHAGSSVTLGGAGGVRQPRVHHQATPVLHQQMAHVAELCRLA
jgi:hypothetical protein